MAAATADRQTQKIGHEIYFDYPVSASTTIYKGTMVAADADGYLVSGADTANYVIVGVAAENVDNSSGSDGDLSCKVGSGAFYRFAASSIAQTSVALTAYIVDNQTFDETTPANSIKCGKIVKVESSTDGWVHIPVGGMSAAS